ncbi:heavy metal-binding domain-containing protein [Mesonia sp. MT50]|uniref:Heavy metal-binding domain-containing protein n=1 Tax=Mesonia profundi TaxID=3070998 RepID=A0ABU1A5V3_9FLAO|nr:heavy metal-binding domain-containing protein [Mesonia profundi]MDQ7918448.1 heavy metal-binding domain-containing protein [Mesonia profundi]
MTEKLENCPNCNADLKNTLLKKNELISINKTKVINEYIDKKSSAHCTKCGNKIYFEFKIKLENEKVSIRKKLNDIINHIPVVTTHSPLSWNYKVLEMVTGQSSTGTGFLTEFTSSFTDLFGTQSGRHNQKIKAGEQICFAQLRKQALDLGGNAVIATDIDYSEIGSGKGILMVCMSGTAILLENTEILGSKKENAIKEYHQLNSRLDYLNKFTLEEF